MKKIITISFAIFALIIIPIHFINKIKEIEKQNTITKYSYTYNYTSEGINFYKTSNTSTLLSYYECDECVLHNINTNIYFKDGVTIIKENDALITFDFVNNKTLNTKKYENKTYDYIKTYDDFLLVIENDTLKLIDYKEDDLLIIDKITEYTNITSKLKNNLLTVKTNNKTYNINTLTYELT